MDDSIKHFEEVSKLSGLEFKLRLYGNDLIIGQNK